LQKISRSGLTKDQRGARDEADFDDEYDNERTANFMINVTPTEASQERVAKVPIVPATGPEKPVWHGLWPEEWPGMKGTLVSTT